MANERSKTKNLIKSEIYPWVENIYNITMKYKDKEYRRSGTPGDKEVRNYIINELKIMGYKNIKEDKFNVSHIRYDEWKLEVNKKEIDCYPLRHSTILGNKDVEGELIYVGESIDNKTIEEIKDKIVVIDMRSIIMPRQHIRPACEYIHDPKNNFDKLKPLIIQNKTPQMPMSYYDAAKYGAKGIIIIMKDFLTGTNKLYMDPSFKVFDKGIPALFIGKYDGEKLVENIKKANKEKTSLNTKIILKGVAETLETANIHVTLPGMKEDIINVLSHHDSGWGGAVQDASGVSVVLAIAKYFMKMPENFRQKTMLFTINAAHYGWEYPQGSTEFDKKNKDIVEKIKLAIGVEHIGKEVKVNEDRKYEIIKDQPVPLLLFSPKNKHLRSTAINMIKQNNIEHMLVPHIYNPFSFPGESQYFFLKGIPSFSLISGPEYLFLQDDCLEFVDQDNLPVVAKLITDLIEAVMYLPGSWYSHNE